MSHNSQVRQNFHKDCEDAINKQINMEFFASYTYVSLATYFDRDDVALPGFSKYFRECSKEETDHAWKLIDYMNKRGGHVIFTEISSPGKQEWGTGQEAMHSALELEKSVNEIYIHLATLSIVLQTVHLLPMEIIKRGKRSVDVFLKPFDVEYQPLDILPDFPVSFPETIQFWNSLSHGAPNHGIVTIPFSDGKLNHENYASTNEPEEYADPFLLKGLDAKRAALILYNKELFFSDIPHERSLLYNQEKRKLNGLAEHTLGSLRPNSLFLRGSHTF